jgi:serine/threonine-protein kinase
MMTRRSALIGAGAALLGRARADTGWRIVRLAGSGEAGFRDGRSAALNGPAGLGVAANGDVIIADLLNNAVRRWDGATGALCTIAGTGEAGFSGDGGPALRARLHHPEGVAVAADGAILIADSGNNRIRRITPGGIIDTIAGGGDADPRHIDGPARAAKLAHPAGVAAGPDGCVYFNDYGHDIIAAVSRDGALQRLAGTGEPGYSGDGGPARQARLNDVYGIGADAAGRLYLCDSLNFAIRKIERGVITTAVSGLSGTPHAKGTIGSRVPHGVDTGPDGRLYIADTASHRLLMAAPGQPPLVLAGSGRAGTLVADGTDALAADIEIHGVRVLKDGSIAFVDFLHHAVYRLVHS